MTGPKLKSFHFDCGNSSTGPVGFCARIRARTKQEALTILKNVLGEQATVQPSGSDEENSRVEYLHAYFNPDKVTLDNIDEVNDADDAA